MINAESLTTFGAEFRRSPAETPLNRVMFTSMSGSRVRLQLSPDGDLRPEEAVTVSAIGELVGRAAELTEVTTAVHQLSEGRASVLAIEGEAGIGKTRLVQQIIGAAQARGVVVFSGRAHPFETSRPFGVVADALDLSWRSPDPRRAAIGAMLAGRSAPGPGTAAGAGHYRVIEDIVDLVDSSCVRGPVLLVTEDLHWADEASLSAISAVTRQLSLSALLVVVTARLGPVSPGLVQLFDDLAASGGRTLRPARRG